MISPCSDNAARTGRHCLDILADDTIAQLRSGGVRTSSKTFELRNTSGQGRRVVDGGMGRTGQAGFKGFYG